MKTCNKCLTEKPFKDFSINKILKNGNKVYKSYCKQCRSKQQSERRKQNIEKFKAKDKKYYDENKRKIQLKQLEYTRTRRQYDHLFRINLSLRARLHGIIKRKTFPFSKLISANSDHIREWFEYQFDDYLNWDNYGNEWQIDHLIPVTHFDCSNEKEAQLCFHWTNLRPLRCKENNVKNNNITHEEITNHIEIIQSYIQTHGYQANLDWWRRVELRYGKNSKDNTCFNIYEERVTMDNPQPSQI